MEVPMKAFHVWTGFAAALMLLLGGSMLLGEDKPAPAAPDEPHHVLVRPDDIKWGPPPPGLPPGAQAAVLTGDPGKAENFVIRIKLPDGYRVAPHWHSVDENITVLSGTLMVGNGDTMDAAAMEEAPAGSYWHMPARMHHSAQAKGETMIQIHGMGPFDITYINPTDDPRQKQ
jgi:quercetin dioxygenase-like cupin family protein